MTDASPLVQKRKLIEVALPLEAINRESAREKSIRHGHPSTLHLWWSRKPLATARAVLFAQLVDDPSSHPDRFPTEADVVVERQRLHDIIERLVVWENSGDQALFRQAYQEILDSTGGNPPPILDPFAGGGTIPLEAQRLGLEAHASDLNPVAVLINRALIEIPPMFAGRPPVNPGADNIRTGSWPNTSGLAEDIRHYGAWMNTEATKRIGSLYPDTILEDGQRATTIAWLWVRTVTCPNPICQIRLPLASKWWLSKKPGKEVFIKPHVESGQVRYEIRYGTSGGPAGDSDGTIGRSGARCIGCGSSVELKYMRIEGKAGRMGTDLMAVVAEGRRMRHYRSPSDDQLRAAQVSRPTNLPDGPLSTHPQYMGAPRYGLNDVVDLFTSRQLVALTTLADLIKEVREQIISDTDENSVQRTDENSMSYADAVSTFLAFGISGLANLSSTITGWRVTAESPRTTFSRQALPMTWDFVESNALHDKFPGAISRIADAVQGLPVAPTPGTARQMAAAAAIKPGFLLSTDPPYYDNIPYSDLSDFFYVWLRRSIGQLHGDLFTTLLAPKSAELVANPYRQGGPAGAHQFFEDGFNDIFRRARETALADFPVTVYYAFKQSDVTSEGEVSTGWESLLEGMVSNRWTITATWPMKSELNNRIRNQQSNALASSIVIAMRPRLDSAPRVARRGFVAALQSELPKALRELQQGAIAPVDLPQAAIGPGMAVFSRYSAVLNDDGTPMRVRAALSLINEVLDEVLSEPCVPQFGGRSGTRIGAVTCGNTCEHAHRVCY